MKTNNFKQIYIATSLFILLLISGVLGFILIENYNLIEAFFMTIITMSTVGYEEVKNLSPEGMIFTSFLIIFSFGIFAYLITAITKYLLDGELKKYYNKYKIEKMLSKIENHVMVCGFGRNGKQAIRELLGHGETVLVLEKKEGIIDEYPDIKNHPKLFYLYGDSTSDELLEKAQISKAKALITTLPSDADNLFVVVSARFINPKLFIISRASEDHSDIKLKRAGANNVIMPDKVGGTRMAKLVAQPDIVEFIESILLRSGGNEVNLEEIDCSKMHNRFLNKSIGELNIRGISGANLIGLKTHEKEYIFNPSADMILKKDYKLFALGTNEQIKKLRFVLSSENQ